MDRWIHNWEIEQGVFDKECPVCGFVIDPRQSTCPMCPIYDEILEDISEGIWTREEIARRYGVDVEDVERVEYENEA